MGRRNDGMFTSRHACNKVIITYMYTATPADG